APRRAGLRSPVPRRRVRARGSVAGCPRGTRRPGGRPLPPASIPGRPGRSGRGPARAGAWEARKVRWAAWWRLRWRAPGAGTRVVTVVTAGDGWALPAAWGWRPGPVAACRPGPGPGPRAPGAGTPRGRA